jgi:tetratricopeptide (TPR) repeat protein
MLKSGNLQTALDIFKGLVAASPHDSVFHCNLAAVYVGMEDYEEAMKAYSRSIELNIGNVDALVGRSELYLRAGKVPEALKDIEVAIKADPEAKKDNTKRARTTLMMLKKMAESAEATKK